MRSSRLLDLVRGALLVEHRLELAAELVRAPAEVDLQDLPDVHAARHAERVEDEIDRAAVGEVRHVLLRQDAADDALVPVAAGHLVADLELALDGDVDLHHLDHARRQLVALGEALDLVAEVLLAGADEVLEIAQDLLDLLALLDGDLAPVLARDLDELGLGDGGALLQEDLALVVHQLAAGGLADEDLAHAAVERVPEDLDLLVAGALDPGALLVLDVARALVLLGPLAGEDARVDDDAADARRDLERAVAHVAGLLAEDRAEQLLLGGELGLALGGDLADEDVARADLGADAHDARVVEVLEGLLADVGDVAGDLLLAELGVAGDALELLDVDRGEDVVLGDALGDEDGVLEVVALPGHERDEHVLTRARARPCRSSGRRRGRRRPSRRRPCSRWASACSRSTGSSAGTS